MAPLTSDAAPLPSADALEVLIAPAPTVIVRIPTLGEKTGSGAVTEPRLSSFVSSLYDNWCKTGAVRKEHGFSE
jgi:hypothetical protein